jgi:GPH family glycoside/pentoside/hexuronide:cation symporter
MFWIGVGVLMQSMIADICDDDELKNGHRREGMFGAVFGWATKASFAVSFVLIGIFLTLIGFDSNLSDQTPSTYLNMRLAMVFGAALPAILCFVLLGFYPLTKEKSEENRNKLEEMRGTV